MDSETKRLNNAHKITYLVKSYPNKPFKDVRGEDGSISENGLVSMLTLPAIDINIGIWDAQDRGFIGEPDPKTDLIPLLDLPPKWEFGEEQESLQATILYAFSKLAGKQRDLEEFNVSQWLAGYAVHDVFVAQKYLLETNKLHEYVIEDGENTYTFYTLYENREKLWGRKEFKQDPLADPKEK